MTKHETFASQTELRAELNRARQHLERQTQVNETLIRWRDSLQHRIQIAELRFEVCGYDDDDEHARLRNEVHDFRRVAKYFAWRGAA